MYSNMHRYIIIIKQTPSYDNMENSQCIMEYALCTRIEELLRLSTQKELSVSIRKTLNVKCGN